MQNLAGVDPGTSQLECQGSGTLLGRHLQYSGLWCASEVAGVTFSDSDAAPVPKYLNPVLGPACFQIWESESCSDSCCHHRSNRNSHMLLLIKWPHRLLLPPKLKSGFGCGSVFSQIFHSGFGSGSERKDQSRLRTPDRWGWTGLWTFWIRTPAASNRIKSEVFSAAPGSGLDLVFAEKMLLVVCLTYIKPESNRIRIACVLLLPDPEQIWNSNLHKTGWDPASKIRARTPLTQGCLECVFE